MEMAGRTKKTPTQKTSNSGQMAMGTLMPTKQGPNSLTTAHRFTGLQAKTISDAQTQTEMAGRMWGTTTHLTLADIPNPYSR